MPDVSRTDGEHKAGVWAAQLPAARPHEVRGGDKVVSVDIIYLLRYIHTISTYFFLPCTHLVCTNQTFILKNIVWKEMLINRIRNISYLE